jgi:hypothetical protein
MTDPCQAPESRVVPMEHETYFGGLSFLVGSTHVDELATAEDMVRVDGQCDV